LFRDLSGLEDIELRLSGTQLTDGGLAHLTSMTSLRVLELGSTQISDAGLLNFRGLTSLRRLDLSGTQITDAGLAHLKHLSSLEHLDLSKTDITDTGLFHLGAMPSLVNLNLAGTRITDAGLAHLTCLRALGELNLAATQITDAGVVAHLSKLPSLRGLNVAMTKATDAGVASIKGLKSFGISPHQMVTHRAHRPERPYSGTRTAAQDGQARRHRSEIDPTTYLLITACLCAASFFIGWAARGKKGLARFGGVVLIIIVLVQLVLGRGPLIAGSAGEAIDGLIILLAVLAAYVGWRVTGTREAPEVQDEKKA
jgi:hypothetical protein